MFRFDRNQGLRLLNFLVLSALVLTPCFATAASRTVVAELWSADG